MEGIVFQQLSYKCPILTLNKNYQNFTLNMAGKVNTSGFYHLQF